MERGIMRNRPWNPMAHPEKKIIYYDSLGKQGEARESSRRYNRMNGTRMNADKELMAE
jgi:hypothetical protein